MSTLSKNNLYVEKKYPFIDGATLKAVQNRDGSALDIGWLDGSVLMDELDGIYFSIRMGQGEIFIGLEEADAHLLGDMISETLEACADCLKTTLLTGEEVHLQSKPVFSFVDDDICLLIQ